LRDIFVGKTELVSIDVGFQKLSMSSFGATVSRIRRAPIVAESCVSVGGLGMDQTSLDAVDEVDGTPGRRVGLIVVCAVRIMFGIAGIEPLSDERNRGLPGGGGR